MPLPAATEGLWESYSYAPLDYPPVDGLSDSPVATSQTHTADVTGMEPKQEIKPCRAVKRNRASAGLSGEPGHSCVGSPPSPKHALAPNFKRTTLLGAAYFACIPSACLRQAWMASFDGLGSV